MPCLLSSSFACLLASVLVVRLLFAFVFTLTDFAVCLRACLLESLFVCVLFVCFGLIGLLFLGVVVPTCAALWLLTGDCPNGISSSTCCAARVCVFVRVCVCMCVCVFIVCVCVCICNHAIHLCFVLRVFSGRSTDSSEAGCGHALGI